MNMFHNKTYYYPRVIEDNITINLKQLYRSASGMDDIDTRNFIIEQYGDIPETIIEQIINDLRHDFKT